MRTIEEKTVGQIVADDYRAASVFASYGIDFCCKGNRTINEVCSEKNIQPEALLGKIETATQNSNTGSIDFKSWPLDLLIDYIEKKHHRYIEEKTPVIRQYLEKICTVHGAHHPELFQIAKLFLDSTGELTKHMKKEELILFPYIRKMIAASVSNKKPDAPHFGTVQNPVRMMMMEHDSEGERFRQISELSGHYTPPADACGTYKVTFALLKEFEEDLHLHIHLENNIVFPAAIEMEEKFQ